MSVMTHCELFSLWTRGRWVLGTNVGSKLFVTVGLVVPLHFIQRSANDRTRGLKHPFALGATKALRVLALNPYQLAWHDRSISLAMSKTEYHPEAGTCLKSGWQCLMLQEVDSWSVQSWTSDLNPCLTAGAATITRSAKTQCHTGIWKKATQGSTTRLPRVAQAIC
jgi:hypothetical protein